MGSAASTDSFHVSTHSLTLPLRLEMVKPTRCDSDLSMAAPMAISTSRIQGVDSPLFPYESLYIQKERSVPRRFFGHRNVARWHSRRYMVMDLSDQHCFITHKCLKASIKHFRVLDQNLVDLIDSNYRY